MAITIRYPKIDFSGIPARWTRNRAFSYDRNAQSLIPTPIEPWLIRILQTAVEKLGPKDAALKDEVLGFIGQESQHFRQHRMFNKAMIEKGYPKLAEIEKRLADDLIRIEKTRSLKFLLAYADGFESMGAISAKIWFEKSADYIEGADPNAVALWGWHLAEEFEHRSVCFDFYHALYGRGPINAIVNGYFYRLYGLIFAMRHLQSYVVAFRSYMLKIDKASMTTEDRAKLRQEVQDYTAFLKRHMLPELLKNFLPWYNPRRKKTPWGMVEYLRQFEPGGPMARTASAPAVA